MFMKSCVPFSVLGAIFLTSSCLGQAAPAQSPIVCEFKDGLAVEDAECQAKLKGLFSRKGDILTLNLDGGRSKTYTGNSAVCDGENVDASKCLVFRMLRYYPQSQFYLVEKGLYECGNYLFVNRRSGRETVMSALPVLSPNGEYLLSIDDSDACDRKYDIAVWSMRTDPPKLEFNYQAKQYENWEITTWKDDSHISLKAWVNGKTSYDQEADLVRGAEGWTLQLGKKTDRPR